MSSFEKITKNINSFFEHSTEPSIYDLAHFGSRIINSVSIAEILEETLKNPDLLETVSNESYGVSENFLKLMLHRDQDSGWGLRVHVFTPHDNQPLDEPWHEHRWNLASSVLKGALHSENAFARIEADADITGNEMYYYGVPDKRVTGKIQPRLLGKCTLQNIFNMSVREGQTYAHHSTLAHHLTLLPEDGNTITSVITAPPNRSEAAFIEAKPLEFKERERPTPLGEDATKTAIINVLDELNSLEIVTDPKPSPFPDQLYVTKSEE